MQRALGFASRWAFAYAYCCRFIAHIRALPGPGFTRLGIIITFNQWEEMPLNKMKFETKTWFALRILDLMLRAYGDTPVPNGIMVAEAIFTGEPVPLCYLRPSESHISKAISLRVIEELDRDQLAKTKAPISEHLVMY